MQNSHPAPQQLDRFADVPFSDDHPVGITVRKLGTEVDIATPVVDMFNVRCTKPKVGDVEGDTVAGV